MNSLISLGRLSSTAWKACIPKNQILKSRVITLASINNYPQDVSKNCHMSNSNRFDIYSKKPICNLNIIKKFSTSSQLGASYKDHDHSKLWTFERLLSLLMLPAVPAALISPCQQLDTVLALLMVMHTHFGLEAIIVDYIRPILFGEMAPKIGIAMLYLFSILTLAGLLNLIYNDCGLANAIIGVWKK